MHLFGGGVKKNDVTLLFDIGNSSIGAALVDLNFDKPKIIYDARVPIDFQRSINAKRFLAAAGTALETLCKRISIDYVQKGKNALHIGKAICLFASPWLMSQPTVIRYGSEKTFALTDELIDKLVEEESERFTKSFTPEGRKSTTQTIEAKVIGTFLNGYELETVHGQHGKEAVIHSFFSAASSEAVALFEKTIHATFHVGEVSFSSFLLAYWSAIRDIYPDSLDFVCLDITGEVTDILVANRGIITNIASFPLGVHTVARTIIDSTAMPAESALSVQSLAALKKTPPVDGRVHTAIKAGISDWTRSMEEAFLKISTHTILPRTLYVSIDEEVATPFIETLRSFEHDALGVAKERFSVEVVGQEFVPKNVILENGIHADPFLLVGAAYVRKILNHVALS